MDDRETSQHREHNPTGPEQAPPPEEWRAEQKSVYAEDGKILLQEP